MPMELKKEFETRLTNIKNSLQDHENSCLILTPGPNLRYLTGYKAKNLERLTCLLVYRDKSILIVPELERLAAIDSGVDVESVEIISWNENQDPYKLIDLDKIDTLFIDDKMTADKLLNLSKIGSFKKILASQILKKYRSIKSKYEMEELVKVGKMIDLVHDQIRDLYKKGDSEKSLAKKIGNTILDVGHESVDFVIVASGANSASPHHEPTEKPIENGDVLVIDIGGTSSSGYCSDSTRTYVVNNIDKEFENKYLVLKNAQEQARKSATKNLTGAQLDLVARNILENENLGKYFIHRTGHGIGMETHEEPYISTNNSHNLEIGNAFSIEPGFYIEGKYGARIEDIVIKQDNNLICCNNSTRDLVILN